MELFSPGHLIPLLIVVAILFFGWKQLPDMARSVGKSLRIFKTEMKGMGDDDAARDAHTAQSAQHAAPPAVAPASTTSADRTVDGATSAASPLPPAVTRSTDAPRHDTT